MHLFCFLPPLLSIPILDGAQSHHDFSIPPHNHPITVLTFADRLYLASYLETPDANTLFPYPDPPPRSPSKRSQRNVEGPSPVKANQKQPFYFTVDDTLLYNAFHHDFGPLHIGHLYRFALQFHEILGAKENKDRPIVFWSRADPRSMFPYFPSIVFL